MVIVAIPTFLLFLKERPKSVPFFNVFDPIITVGTGVSAHPAKTLVAGQVTFALVIDIGVTLIVTVAVADL